MSSNKWLFSTFAVLWCLSFSLSAADKKSKEVKPDEAGLPSYERPQPATENLDFTMYQRIRDEGLAALARDGVCLGGWRMELGPG